jgi:hypothetical protein
MRDRAGATPIEEAPINPLQYFAPSGIRTLLQFTMSHAVN